MGMQDRAILKARSVIASMFDLRIDIGWKNERQVTKWTDEMWQIAKPIYDAANRAQMNGDLLGFHRLLEKAESYAYAQLNVVGNTLLDEGGTEIWELLTGQGTTELYDNANARLGVGTSGAAIVRNQTGLQAGGDYRGMEAGYPNTPVVTTGVAIDFKSQWETGEANQDWKEQALDNGATQAKDMFRTITNLGTKASGVWTLTTTITLS